MPYFGLLPFLPTDTKEDAQKWYKGFNALLRASSFSTQKKSQMRRSRNVSMPYFGLLPFLHYVSTAIDFTGFPASIL